MITALKKRNKKGFTLVELVIVIAVLAILAAIAIPTVTNVINTANKNTDLANCQTIELALKSADAEVTAKTSNAASIGTTVSSALAYEGLNLSTLTSNLKTGTSFSYGTAENTGKIYVTGATGNPTGIVTIDNTTTLDAYISGTAKSS